MEQSFNRVEHGCSVREEVEAFLRQRVFKSENTRAAYARCLRAWADEMPPAGSMRAEQIEKYIMSLKKKYKTRTINLVINAIKAFYAWADLHFGEKNLGRYIQRVDELPPEQRILSRREYESVAAMDRTDERECFVLLCNTGLRATEFMALTMENFAGGFLRVVGKGRKRRSVPLNAAARGVLARNPDLECVRGSGRVWLFRACKKLAADAGIETFNPHACRHWFANELWRAGVPVSTISRLLGHASTAVTENVYIHWSESDLSGITDKLL